MFGLEEEPDIHDGPENDHSADSKTIICPEHTTARKLMRRVDLRLLPVLVVLYLMAFLDR